MKRNYEGVYILKLQGQEEGIDEMIGKITKELESNGAKLEKIERLGRKEFVFPKMPSKSMVITCRCILTRNRR